MGVLKRLLIYCYELTQQFLVSTVLSGLKYLTFKYITVWEKLFFLSCFIATSYNSIYFAVTIVEKWQTSPVITVKNPHQTSITEEPFPAITICNMNQAQYSKVNGFKVGTLEYALVQKLCFQNINYSSLNHIPRPDDHKFSKFIVDNSQSCKDMILYCKFGSTVITCTDLFREVLLDEGLCCSFNVVHPFMQYKGDYYMIRDYTAIDDQSIPVSWSPETGYPKELPSSFYPRLALGDGFSNGFTLILNGDVDNYFCSSTNGPGFKVFFHNPIDTPHIKETGLSVALGYRTIFRVMTLKEETEESLKMSTKPHERECYFTDEYPLHYYRYYTRHNCEMECDSLFMLNRCNCVPYHMPILWENVTECSMRHFDCWMEAEKNLMDSNRLKCKKECLSSCNDFSYTPEAFATPILFEYNYKIINSYLKNMSREYLNNNIALLKILFNENIYNSNVKKPYMGLTEFLSQTGGLMSLMTGFSVISVVEIVFFFIIKPIINVWHKIVRAWYVGLN